MVELIVATNTSGGIGMNNQLPWNCKEDLKLFKELSMNKTLIVGRKTAESLPVLPGRSVLYMTKKPTIIKSLSEKKFTPISCLDEYKHKNNVMIAGGSNIYKLSLESNMVNVVHLSIIKNVDDIECDTFFDYDWLRGFIIDVSKDYETFHYYKLKRSETGEQQYLDLIRKIINDGSSRNSRSGKTLSLFQNSFVFDLTKGFPLLTTKRMFLRGILEEFLFFMREAILIQTI